MKISLSYNFFCGSFFLMAFYSYSVLAQYVQKEHQNITEGMIPVEKQGNYDRAGVTYMLVNDISSPRSAIFLGKDVTLDLNGYTITFADTTYQQLPNFSFEKGLESWDISRAPNAKIVGKEVHVLVGDSVLSLSKGEEIVSEYIHLPIENRSYLAMVGVGKMEMSVSIFVEDEKGRTVICNTQYQDGKRQSSPIEKRSPRLGGGFVFAHLNGLESRKYRIRVRAETDCLLDHIDIRPSMDVGIGIVGDTHSLGHNDHLYEDKHTAFFDYSLDPLLSSPLPGIPQVKGKGTVTIRNGVIKNGVPGAISFGIQSTASDVEVILDNIKIINSGINATAADLLHATITNSTFDVDNPFIINRHGSQFYGVDLRGEKSSEVSYSAFFGGQGCLVFKGNSSKIHHNLFVNRQMVTNHYSIMAMGDSSLIFDNIIQPEIGSGIEIYKHRGIEIFNNEIHTKASPPTSEYGHETYSTTAIRIADYNALPGSAEGCFGNKVYNNKILVSGFDFPEFPDYVPMAWAVFYSASGGQNEIFGNEIWVDDKNLGLKNETSAFYIGGGSIGGLFYENRITTNVPAAWVASPYGAAKDTQISRNTIMKADDALGVFPTIRMGWSGNSRSIAEGIDLRSNILKGMEFGINATDQLHGYSLWWTLKVKINQPEEEGGPGKEILILDRNGEEVFILKPEKGKKVYEVELKEFSVVRGKKTIYSPYTLKSASIEERIDLDQNREIDFTFQK
ncbi:MAG: hypothetical protein WD398_02210 [Cyclobacteriaceae bacterium]